MIRVEVLWWKSRRELATLACARATVTRALSLLLLPGCLRARDLWSLRSFRSARRRNFGDRITVPSDSTANDVRPRSIPASASLAGTGNREVSSAETVSTTNEAKYRPAGSRITVTLAGAEGRSRDQRTSKSPIFGRRSRPLGRILNRAFAVNRIACLRSLRDLNRGRWTLGPLRLPVTEAKKFR